MESENSSIRAGSAPRFRRGASLALSVLLAGSLASLAPTAASAQDSTYTAPPFSESAAGLPDGWSDVWQEGQWSTVGQEFPVLHQHTTNSGPRRAASPDAVGQVSGDVEAHATMRVPGDFTSDTRYGLGVHLSMSDNGGTGYYTDVRAGELRINMYNTEGNFQVLARQDFPFGEVETDVWYNLVLQREGDTLRSKIWPYGEDEPAEWLVSVDDTTYSEGRVGVTAHSSGAKFQTAYFAAGTDGAAAPRIPADYIPTFVDDPLQTAFQNSDGHVWTEHADEVAFLEAVDAASDRVEVDQIGQSANGLPIHMARIGYPTAPSSAEAAEGQSVLIVATQHGNEPAGQEMALQKISELAFTDDPELIAQLQETTILVIPTMNPDGRMLNQRRLANDVDMNRDHLALEQIETRVMANAIHFYNPDVIIDAHEKPTTIGGADIDALWPRNLNGDAAVRELSESLVRDYVFQDFEDAGRSWYVYGGEGPEGVGDANPGIGRNSIGLRGSVGMLIETAGLRPGVERVTYQHAAVDAALRFQHDNAAEIAAAVAEAPLNRAADGLGRAPFYFGLAADNKPPTAEETLDPGACGYILTEEQAEQMARQFESFGVQTEPGDNPGEVLVSMAQPAMTVIPLLLDPMSDVQFVDAQRIADADCPLPLIENTEAPTIAGEPTVGETLSVDGGEWEPAEVNLTYQWFADAAPIDNATGSTLELTADLEGAVISVEVTAAADGYESATVEAAPVGPVAAAADNGDDDGAGDDGAGGGDDGDQDGDGSGAGGGSELPVTGAAPSWSLGALAALLVLAAAALAVIRRRRA